MGQRLWAGAPGLAHRMLGHELRRRWARPSTSTAAAPTCSFRTTRTKSPRAKAPPASRWRASGCTTALCAWTTRRCPRAWATSSPSARCWPSTTPRRCVSSSCARTTAAPLNYSDVHLDDARDALKRLYTALDAGARRPPWRSTGRSPLPRASRRRWTRTSARPRRWPCCSSWPARSTAAARPSWPGLLKALGGCLGLLQGDPKALPAGGRRRWTRPAIQRMIVAARGSQGREELCRGRPHPPGTAGPGHRAQGLRRRHHLGSGPVMSFLHDFRPCPASNGVDVCYKEQSCPRSPRRTTGTRPASTWSRRTGS